MAKISVKRVLKEKLQQEIEDSQVAGWNLESQNENVAILTKAGGWGSLGAHLIIMLLSAWWTFFIGNLIYAVYVHLTSKQELQIKADSQ